MSIVSKKGFTADFSKADWRKSTKSNPSGNCVEIAFAGDLIGVRDSKNPSAVSLVFTKDEWKAFLAGTKEGEFDLKNS